MPRNTWLRAVVRTVRRLVFGQFGSKSRDELKPLNVDVVPDRVDPTVDETIPVEVTGLGEVPASATRLGPRDAFDIDERSETVAVVGESTERLAEPAEVMDFENPHMHGKLMDFRTADVPLPEDRAERREVDLALGVFLDGPVEVTSLDRWDADRVTIPPRGSDN